MRNKGKYFYITVYYISSIVCQLAIEANTYSVFTNNSNIGKQLTTKFKINVRYVLTQQIE